MLIYLYVNKMCSFLISRWITPVNSTSFESPRTLSYPGITLSGINSG